MPKKLSIAALFSGIGGIEEGFHKEGGETVLFCEKDVRAQAVLRSHYPDVPIFDDIVTIEALPKVDVITAGFPCQDLSQAGLKKGINGAQSGLVQHLFRVLESSRKEDLPEWIVIENVSYIISLESGNAIKYLVQELESLGYMWGYRVVDARAFGVPQRRLRLLLIASKTNDVRNVLFSQNIEVPPVNDNISDIDENVSYGFYWTEGKRGLGWTVNGIPTLKIGSKIGIPSPPAIWIPKEDFFGTPDIRDAERLQGFPINWTLPTLELPKSRIGDRWHLVGNAVCVNMSHWLAQSIISPGTYDSKLEKQIHRQKLPKAAYGFGGKVYEVSVGTWPVAIPCAPLYDFLQFTLKPLSQKGISGFYSRAVTSILINYPERFISSMEQYLKQFEGELL